MDPAAWARLPGCLPLCCSPRGTPLCPSQLPAAVFLLFDLFQFGPSPFEFASPHFSHPPLRHASPQSHQPPGWSRPGPVCFFFPSHPAAVFTLESQTFSSPVSSAILFLARRSGARHLSSAAISPTAVTKRTPLVLPATHLALFSLIPISARTPTAPAVRTSDPFLSSRSASALHTPLSILLPRAV
jgi:hypothetical protein